MAGDAKRRRMRRARAGYTLVEMLAALAVLSIMTVMVSTGVSAGVRAYERAQFTSQADMLSATINSSLDGAFRFMQNGDSTYSVTLDGRKVSFSKGSSALEVDDGKLCLADSSEGPVKLVNDGIYGMCVVDSVDQVECTMDNVEFSYVISNGASLSRAYSFVATPQRGVKRDSGVASGTGTSLEEGSGTADKTELGKEIALVEAIDLSGDETAAKEALKTALEAAKVVADKTDATQDEVDKATAELAAARRAYENSGSGSGFDYARLDAALKSADDNAAWRTDGGTLAVGVQDAYAKATQARAGVGVTTQDEVTAAAIVLEDALSAFLSSKVLNVERVNKAISDADAAKPWQSDNADAVSNLQSAYDAAKAALAAGESQEALDNAAAALESALAAYEDSLSGGGGEGGDDDEILENAGAPTIGGRVDAAIADCTSQMDNQWTRENSTWKQWSDASGTAYDALNLAWDSSNTVCAIVYYDGKYYKPVSEGGQDVATVLLASVSAEEAGWRSAFSASDLLDGKNRNYGSGALHWVLIATA